jgi:hypothetical protein
MHAKTLLGAYTPALTEKSSGISSNIRNPVRKFGN